VAALSPAGCFLLYCAVSVAAGIAVGEVRAQSPDSLAFAPTDSSASVLPAPEPTPVARPVLYFRGLTETPATWSSLSDTALAGGHDGTLREALPWSTDLRRIPSGSYYQPDPMDWGDLPGREPPAWVEQGMPLGAPSHPESPPDLIGPLWAERAVLRPADPLTWPNQPTGGPLLEWELQRADSNLARSAVRLSSGTNDTHTEEFFLSRPLARGALGLFYADHKTFGRILYLGEKGENLLARFDRPTSWGRWSASARHHQARSRLIPDSRWLFDLSGFELEAVRPIGRWEVSGQSSFAWQRLALESDPFARAGSAKRKDATVRTLVRLRGPALDVAPLAGLHPRLTLEWDHTRLRYYEPAVLSLDRRDNGLGLAIGVDGVTKGWRMRASAGRAAFGGDRSGLTASIEGARTVRTATLTLLAQRGVRPRLEPRLADRLDVQVRQDLIAPDVDPSAPLEELTQFEIGVATSREPRLRGEVRLRAVHWEGRVAPRQIDVLALHGGAGGRVWKRLEFELRAVVRHADPSWREQLWATPWEMWGTLSWSQALFSDRLRSRAFLRAEAHGEQATPFGRLGSSERFDGGVDLDLGAAQIYFVLFNLEDDIAAAAGYDDGFMLLPYRSFRMGLTWRFID